VGHTVSAIINNSIKLYYSNLGSSSSDTLHYITFICLVPGLQQPGVAWQYKTVAVISCKLLINYYIESLHHHCPPPPDPLHLLSVLHLSLLIKYQSFVSPWLFFPLQRLHTYRISSISDLHLNLIFQGSFYYRFWVIQDHRKWHYLRDRIRVPIHLPLYLWPYLVLFSK